MSPKGLVKGPSVSSLAISMSKTICFISSVQVFNLPFPQDYALQATVDKVYFVFCKMVDESICINSSKAYS
jgi:hypothetical protein